MLALIYAIYAIGSMFTCALWYEGSGGKMDQPFLKGIITAFLVGIAWPIFLGMEIGRILNKK